MKRTQIDIRRAIKERGYSLSAFAEKCNMTPSNLSKNIINGNPTVKKLTEICEVLGCDITDLFYPIDEPDTAEAHAAAPSAATAHAEQTPDAATPTAQIPAVAYCPHCGARVRVGVVLIGD